MSNNPAAVAPNPSKLDLIRKKREELGSIARGHKRKLREYLIASQCDPSIHPLPIISTTFDQDHQKFLDEADITKGRRFQESSIPPRRQLRSDTAKLAAATTASIASRISPSPLSSSTSTLNNIKPLSKATKPLNSSQDTTEAQPRHDEPNGQLLTEDSAPLIKSSKEKRSDSAVEISGAQNGPSKRRVRGGSQEIQQEEDVDMIIADGQAEQSDTETLPINFSDLNGDLTNGEGGHASPSIAPIAPSPIPVKEDARDEPAEDPTKCQKDAAVPVLFKEPSKEELQSQETEIDSRLAKTVTPRDPPYEVPSSISLQIPKVAADVVSSPESTSGALSATTPALHEASTDTSPDNEALHYDPNLSQRKLSDADSPTASMRNGEENPSISVSKEEIAETPVEDCPSSADAQLQLDAEQAAAAVFNARTSVAETPDSGRPTRNPAIGPHDIDDEDVVMGGVSTPQDVASLKEVPTHPLDPTKEIPDSQESQSTGQMVDDSVVAQRSVSRDSRVSPEKQSNATKETSPTTSTPRRTPSIAPPIERMTTRVSSGAIRNRSVSEIIGEKEYQTTSPTETSGRKASESQSSKSTSRASTPQTPLMRSIVGKSKDKERSKLSHVIFANKPNKRLSDEAAALPPGSKQKFPKSDDYLRPYFEAQASEKLGFQPLQGLLLTSHKSISTADANLPIQQTQMLKILRRVQHLQQDNKWSLRQPKRAVEPNRPTTHRDLLIQEMKWMRTDFREERKWKMAVARNLAHDCADYHEAVSAEQAVLKVTLRRPTRKWKSEELAVRKDCYHDREFEVPEDDVEMADASNHSTPDLTLSGEDSSPPEDFDEEVVDIRDTAAPTAIFTLADDEVVFRLTSSPTSEKLLNELPLYGCPLRAPHSILPTSEISPDAHWKRPILPLSKYTDGQMVIVDKGPPRRKSRYEYETEDDDDGVVFGERHTQPKLPPENSDVALFNPENKHIRDRIHAGHQFRPPSEFPMPMQSFFENREPSQWTKEEEDELKAKVRDYSYNWSLISSELQRGSAQSCSLYNTVAERRTPWECFERWVSMEGLPQDMAKTTYFRAYTSRLATAERNLAQQSGSINAQAPNGANGPAQLPKRPKRSAVAMRVPARRNQKHLHLVDAMRKNAKKKENALTKQAQAAATVQQRKANEQANAPPRPAQPAVPTPQELSRMKHERETAMRERMERYQQTQLAQRQQAIQQARLGQAQPNPQLTPQQQQALHQQQQQQQQQQRNNVAANGNPPNAMPNSQNLAVPGQNRNSMQQAGSSLPMQLSNPNGLAPPMSMNGIPQAQMQNMQNIQNMQGLRGAVMPPNTPSPAQIMAARQISEQQRALSQQQHAQSGNVNGQLPNSNPNMNGQGSPPNMRNGLAMGAINMNMNQGNPAMRPNFMSAMNNAGVSNASPNMGLPPPSLQQGSPTMGRPQMGQIQHLAITNELRVKYPNASPEQIQQYIRNSIANRQNAMQAAAGNGGSPIAAFNAGSPIAGSLPNPISNSGINLDGTGDNNGNINGLGNAAAMMRGSLGNASGLQPQMYASMLRQQQQQQQMQQMHAHQQAQGGGHGRSGSGGQGGQNGQQGQNQQQGVGNNNGQQGNGGSTLK